MRCSQIVPPVGHAGLRQILVTGSAPVGRVLPRAHQPGLCGCPAPGRDKTVPQLWAGLPSILRQWHRLWLRRRVRASKIPRAAEAPVRHSRFLRRSGGQRSSETPRRWRCHHGSGSARADQLRQEISCQAPQGQGQVCRLPAAQRARRCSPGRPRLAGQRHRASIRHHPVRGQQPAGQTGLPDRPRDRPRGCAKAA